MQSAPMHGAPAHRPEQVYAVLLAGVAAVSLGAIFARLAQDAGLPSLLISAGRVVISSLLLTGPSLRRHGPLLRTLRPRDLALASAAGLLLAVHFSTWISSLEYTSVLMSVVLVSTGPLWIALLEVLFLGARLNRLIVLGLAVTFGGGLMIAASASGGEAMRDPALGAALALTGAFAGAGYLVLGRGLRHKLPLLPYVWLVYSCAALALVLILPIARVQVAGHPAEGWLWVLLMALFPQLIGHTSFNYALRFLPATVVGIAAQMESVGSAIAAAVLFAELPTAGQLAGSVVIIAGVLLSTLGQARVKGR